MQEDNNDRDIDRLYSLYEVNSDNFRKVFGILVGFGIFFILTLVLPYFLNIYEYDKSKIETLNQNNSIHQANTTIQNLIKKVTSTQREIETLSKTFNNTKSMMTAQIQSVNNSLSAADKLLTNIDDESVVVKLRDILNKTQYKRDKTLRFADNVLQYFNDSISSYGQRIDTLNQKLNSTNLNMAIAKSNLDKGVITRSMLNNSINNLTERWKEIQTPFGNLPIDFTSLLAVFPIGLSAGFLLCSGWLAESIRFRMIIHQIRDEGREKQQYFKKGEIYLVTPLWIDPANPKQNKTIQYLLLGIPAMIFVLSVILISYTWEHAPSPPFPSASEVNKYIYYALYVSCSGIFAHSFWRVLKEVTFYYKFIRSGNI